ncbi:MAG: site-2 protease family protein [Cyanobacteriota bacterium]|nr:site-2 protease family protein [Cyanobacteriota bacterium]
MFLRTLAQNPIFFVQVIAIVVISICLHELAHGIAALSQGDDTPERTGHITLNPVVHMGVPSLIFLCVAGISWGAMPVNPSKFRHPKWSNIIVSAAGPLLNITLTVLLVIAIQIVAALGWTNVVSTDFLFLGASINVRLFLFNLLPIPPLDGFHVFSELFPFLKPLKNSQYSFLILMLVFMSPAFGRGLTLGSSFILTPLVKDPIALLVAVGTILTAIVFAFIAAKLPSASSTSTRQPNARNRPASKKGFFDRFKQPNTNRLWREILKRVDGGTAQRLIDLEKRKNPSQPESWYLDKVLYDLKRGR